MSKNKKQNSTIDQQTVEITENENTKTKETEGTTAVAEKKEVVKAKEVIAKALKHSKEYNLKVKEKKAAIAKKTLTEQERMLRYNRTVSKYANNEPHRKKRATMKPFNCIPIIAEPEVHQKQLEIWNKQAEEAFRNVAELRAKRTVITTATYKNKKGESVTYSKKELLQPVFNKNTKQWSIDEAKKRFSDRLKKRAVNLENRENARVFLEERKMKKLEDKAKHEYKITINRFKEDGSGEDYAFKTDPFVGTKTEMLIHVRKLREEWEVDSSFNKIVILKEGDKPIHINRITERSEIKNAA